MTAVARRNSKFTARRFAFRRSILRWYRSHARGFPWRNQSDPYAVLIGEILLQRTRGENAVAVYSSFLHRWPDAGTLASAREASIASVIRPLGLTKRAAILRRLGRELVAIGAVPLEPKALMALSGVGPYAAHSVPVFARSANLPIVDWVIARVLRRYFGLNSDKRPNADSELWKLAAELISLGKARELWLGTLDFAAAVCKPRPLCDRCPLSSSCAYYESTLKVS